VRVRIQFANRRDQLHAKARGGVHGNVERDEIGFAYRFWTKRFPGKVEAGDYGTPGANPRRRRGQTKRLVAKLVGGDQNDIHRRDTRFAHQPIVVDQALPRLVLRSEPAKLVNELAEWQPDSRLIVY
jgi:hypothetical protein